LFLGKIKKLLLIGEGRKFSEVWSGIPTFWKVVIILAVARGLSKLPEFINNLQTPELVQICTEIVNGVRQLCQFPIEK
jgi:ABC-type microcin C transport system permease subunit YejE